MSDTTSYSNTTTRDMNRLIFKMCDDFNNITDYEYAYIANWVIANPNKDLGDIQSAIRDIDNGNHPEENNVGDAKMARAFLRKLEDMWLQWERENPEESAREKEEYRVFAERLRSNQITKEEDDEFWKERDEDAAWLDSRPPLTQGEKAAIMDDVLRILAEDTKQQ